MYYFMLCCATALFSLQYVFNKAYQKNMGETLTSSCLFSMGSALVFGVILFVYNGCALRFSWFSALLALANAIVCVLCGYCSIVSLSIADLSKYTLYLMLGGMAIPFAYGFAFNGDTFTWQKIVCFVLVAIALVGNSMDGAGAKKTERKGKWCYAGIFVLNGMTGVIATMHQMPAQGMTNVPTNDFIIWCNIMQIVVSAAVLCFVRSRGGAVSLPEGKNALRTVLLAVVGYGVVHGVATVLDFISLLHIEPTVQFPIITGGCVVLGVVFGLFFKEKITKRKALWALVTLAGTLVLVIP